MYPPQSSEEGCVLLLRLQGRSEAETQVDGNVSDYSALAAMCGDTIDPGVIVLRGGAAATIAKCIVSYTTTTSQREIPCLHDPGWPRRVQFSS